METFINGRSAAFNLSSEERIKIFKAIGYSVVSVIIAGLIAIFASKDVQLPIWLVPLIPSINAFLYGVKLWMTDNRIN